ncbi:hypothetical protein FJW06_28035 [Mesorhizobium sp. B4-1-3]|uniref:hypothetical protein n=1 Tax=Mesorhizobium sp. B4-1-3 TaxID=2589889 RepID=UPI00112A5394|nr:hypothetical protein [Mesorhizobium sp. B4-1-3]TPI08729.1 hypothetical protein FJW06_28035 [Mesorhizobium sp. B4-1-3]
MTKTDASVATIQNATHIFKVSGPYAAMLAAIFSIPLALACLAAAASGASTPSLPNARGGSRLETMPDVLNAGLGAAVGRPSFVGDFFLAAERVGISFYRRLAAR